MSKQKYSASKRKVICRILIITLIGVSITLIGTISAQSLPLAQTRLNTNRAEVTIPPENMLSENMLPENIRSIIYQARDAWVQGDAEAFVQLFATDSEFVVPGNRYVGIDAIRRAVTDFTALSLEVTIEIKRILIDGEQAAVEWYWQDHDPKTGQGSRADDVIIVDFVEGKISRWREYIDSQSYTN